MGCGQSKSVEVVEENAAGAPCFLAVRKKKIIVALGFEARIVLRIMGVAGGLESGVEIARIVVDWRARELVAMSSAFTMVLSWKTSLAKK